MTSDKFTITATDVDKKIRLDKFLSSNLPDLSRSRIQQLIEQGQVCKSNHVIEDCAYKIKDGDSFEINVPPAESSDMKGNDSIKLDIIFEDDNFMIINKQAGLTVHPGAGNFEETMVNALLATHADKLSGIGGVQRPGIVHRLDKDTSGLIMVAKNDMAHHHLSEQIAQRTAKRTYLAICWGVPKPHNGTIESNIDRNPKHRLKMTSVKSGGKHAITHYSVKKIYANGAASLVECKLQTGRTHQIRVHMSDIGHPLIGDPLYGRKNPATKTLSDDAKEYLKQFKRQALHAYKLNITNPSTDEEVEFECCMPDDMEKLINNLET